MHALGPTVAELLLELAAREQEPGGVEVIAAGIETGAPDHHRRVLDQQTVFRGRQRPCHAWNYLTSRSLRPSGDAARQYGQHNVRAAAAVRLRGGRVAKPLSKGRFRTGRPRRYALRQWVPARAWDGDVE